MPIIPANFLIRATYRCRYLKSIPQEDRDNLLDLSESHRIKSLATVEGAKEFADVRMAWNELGIGLQVQVLGKEMAPAGMEASPRSSDGVTLWIDTRDARTSHRASRFCHQFHFLASGGGPDHDEPVIVQTKINRALQDAPMAAVQTIPFRMARNRGGYRIEAFLPAGVLHGYDPEQNPRLGFYHAIHDAELGQQVLNVGAEFPYWEDPSLWSTLELAR
jgi:hypothetical protein